MEPVVWVYSGLAFCRAVHASVTVLTVVTRLELLVVFVSENLSLVLV